MPTNDFQVFAGGENADVLSQASYLDLEALTTGFQSGIAQSVQCNKVWRQASIISAMIAQFICDQSGQNAVDDGTTSTLETNFNAALIGIMTTLLTNGSVDPVFGTTTVEGGASVSGTATAGSLNVTHQATLGSAVVTGSATMGSAQVNGPATITGPVTVPNAVLSNQAVALGQLTNGSISPVFNPATSGFTPIGGIIMWSGALSALPSNWHLCDGSTIAGYGTVPDLRDRFVVGSGNTYTTGAEGGSTTISLAVANLPPHNHAVSDPSHTHAIADPSHTHGVNDPTHVHQETYFQSAFGNNPGPGASGSEFGGQTGSPIDTEPSYTGVYLDGAFTGIGIYASYTGIGIENTGSGTPVASLPPYIALAYIIRIA